MPLSATRFHRLFLSQSLLLLLTFPPVVKAFKHRVLIAVNEGNSGDWKRIDAFLSDISNTSESFDLEVKPYSFGINDTEISHFAIDKVIGALESDSVSVLIGSYNPIIHLAAEERGLPYLVTSDGVNCEIQRQQFQISRRYALSMTPPPDILSSAILELTKTYHWEDMTVIYDMQKGFQLLASIMSSPPHKVRGWKLSHEMSDEAIRSQLLELRQMNLRHIIVSCEPSLLERILFLALRLSMLSENFFWVIADLNPFAVDLKPYNDTRVNLTLFQYFDPAEIKVFEDKPESKKSLVQDLLLHDSLTIVHRALLDYTKIHKPPSHTDKAIRLNGTELVRLLTQNHINGKTGQVKFDPTTGTRTDVMLQVMALNSSGVTKIGEWRDAKESNESRLTLTKWIDNFAQFKAKSRFGTDVVEIVTVLDPPFVMCKNKSEPCHPNETTKHDLEGFLVDMIEMIANHKPMEFQYKLYLSPDGNYGSKDDKGEWNGMIRELMIGKATMCLGAISITAVREEAVDFTKPFKQKQFNLLMKKPMVKTSPFQFLWPLSWEVWALTLMAMVFVGMLLFVMDRITPNSKHSEERFDIHESLFFIYGTLVGPGTEMVPRTISGRILSMAWWFFGMILVSSYTANLAAFLTVSKIETPIKSIADLADQTKIKYGTVRNTYAMSMFSKSEVTIYKKMWDTMKIQADSLVANTSEGISKVQKGDFAFIWDQPINDYLATTICDVISTGEPFDEKGYGIGVPIGAAYRDDITMVILELQEKGKIKSLEDKWWNSGTCQVFKDTLTASKELKMNNVLGIFLVLAAGAAVSFFVCLLEFIILKLKQHRQHMAEAVKLSAAHDDRLHSIKSAVDEQQN